MAMFYKKWKKYYEIQLTKKYLNIRKMKNHPPSPDIICTVNEWVVHIKNFTRY